MWKLGVVFKHGWTFWDSINRIYAKFQSKSRTESDRGCYRKGARTHRPLLYMANFIIHTETFSIYNCSTNTFRSSIFSRKGGKTCLGFFVNFTYYFFSRFLSPVCLNLFFTLDFLLFNRYIFVTSFLKRYCPPPPPFPVIFAII